ncbi:hypothetical protein [Pseudoduganella aquatica]|uniref:hypothetical protein n=1 Tax=Pseudoduganella aquatica TaxID=2660641 RepID=UPI001E2FEF00|nr:hypothetical protein [Pseudoduganella aquatica]
MKSRLVPAGVPEPEIEIEESNDGGVDVFFFHSAPAGSTLTMPVLIPLRERILNVQPDHLTIWPINVRPDKDDYLLPKYGTLERIRLTKPARTSYELPESRDDVIALLEGLPDGFSKQFEFGLGLLWENRFICEAIADIPGIDSLVLHGGAAVRTARIDSSLYILGLGRFHELRRELARSASRHQRAARSEKQLLAYQHLLHAADRDAFPRKTKRLQADAIADMTNVGGERTKLSKRYRRSVVKLVNENVEELAKAEPQALLSLKADIERVTLKELIGEFEAKLSKNLTEKH